MRESWPQNLILFDGPVKTPRSYRPVSINSSYLSVMIQFEYQLKQVPV